MDLKELLEGKKILQDNAKEFWKDKSNSLEERIKCFEAFAEINPWVITRDNSIQRHLFDKAQENDMFSKNETVTYSELIEIYLDDKENPDEVLERMEVYLWNKILQGDYQGFRFYW